MMRVFICGGGEIRTHEGFHPGAFQVRCTRPTMRRLRRAHYHLTNFFLGNAPHSDNSDKSVPNLTIHCYRGFCLYGGRAKFRLLHIHISHIALPARRLTSFLRLADFALCLSEAFRVCTLSPHDMYLNMLCCTLLHACVPEWVRCKQCTGFPSVGRCHNK